MWARRPRSLRVADCRANESPPPPFCPYERPRHSGLLRRFLCRIGGGRDPWGDFRWPGHAACGTDSLKRRKPPTRLSGRIVSDFLWNDSRRLATKARCRSIVLRSVLPWPSLGPGSVGVLTLNFQSRQGPARPSIFWRVDRGSTGRRCPARVSLPCSYWSRRKNAARCQGLGPGGHARSFSTGCRRCARTAASAGCGGVDGAPGGGPP